MSFTQDIQQLEPGNIVQLIEIDGTAFGMETVLRFHAFNISDNNWNAFAGENLPAIIWQGNQYDPYPYALKGVELSTGSQPTPTLSVGNIGNYVTALCLEYDDLVKAKVKIHTTLVKYLDAANWVSGNPAANPNEERCRCFMLMPKKPRTELRLILNSAHLSIYRACSCHPADNPCLYLVPPWAVPEWNGCDYAGTLYFLKDGTPTTNPALDVCGGRLPDCEARFGPGNPLPFGGFPAANLQGK
jgi:lambda family phage minor tail protein L